MCCVPTISNSSGSFVGTELENDVSAFLGIQYASAKRFCQPTDIKKYSSIVNAQTFGPQSPQVPGFMDEILNTKSLPSSEECLYLKYLETNSCTRKIARLILDSWWRLHKWHSGNKLV
ncbi:MAG: hypothetical protein EBQ54_09320 [Actinobacteria bacterium]|nr:hypothetical protein [Actinomycetota bacterium]